jgi:hypothetical protein
MDLTLAERLLYLTPRPIVVLAIVTLALTAFLIGGYVRPLIGQEGRQNDLQAQKGFLLSSAIGVLALLLGFTFSIAITRFEARRQLIIEQANEVMAISVWSRAADHAEQEQIHDLLLKFVETTVAAGKSDDPLETSQLIAQGRTFEDRILEKCVTAAHTSPNDITSNNLLRSAEDLAEISVRRVAARRGHVPVRVYITLFTNLAFVAAGIGFEFTGRPRYIIGTVLLFLLSLTLTLIIDLDRPIDSKIDESQWAMEGVYARLKAQPL